MCVVDRLLVVVCVLFFCWFMMFFCLWFVVIISPRSRRSRCRRRRVGCRYLGLRDIGHFGECSWRIRASEVREVY